MAKTNKYSKLKAAAKPAYNPNSPAQKKFDKDQDDKKAEAAANKAHSVGLPKLRAKQKAQRAKKYKAQGFTPEMIAKKEARRLKGKP